MLRLTLISSQVYNTARTGEEATMSVVSDICDRILADRVTDRWDGYVNMLKILKNAFSSERHWILEFLQNAEDVGAPRFSIRLSKEGLLVLNNGHPFDKTEVRAICDVKSSKLIHLGFRGWLGVGFKSIFKVSSKVEIHSDDLHFAFDRQYWADRHWNGAPSGAEFPWEILPIECAPVELPDGYVTGFWVPASKDATPMLERLAQFLGSSQLPSEMVLLLDKVKTVDIQLTGGALQIEKTIVAESKREVGTNKTNKHQLRVQEVVVEVIGKKELARRSSRNSYLVIRSDRPVPDGVRSSAETEELRRSQVPKREVGLVFGLEDGTNLRVLSGALGGVYSFLPVEAEQTGLPFGIFGDFVPHPNRVAVNEGLTWNHWLCVEVANLLEESVNYVFLDEERWKSAPIRLFAWLQQEPLKDAATRFWAERVRQPVRQFLAEGSFYPDRDGTLRRLADLVYIEDELETALGGEGMTDLLQGKHLAHPDVVRELGSEITRVGLYELVQEHRGVFDVLRVKPERLAKVYSLASDERSLSPYQIGGRKGRKEKDTPLNQVPFALGADDNFHAPCQLVHVALDMPSQPRFVKAIVRRKVSEVDTTLNPVVARDDSAVRGLQRCGLRVIQKGDLVWEVQRQIEAVRERGDSPSEWDFPGDLIYATLFVAKEKPFYKPKRLLGEDGYLYDPNLLFIRNGPLDWSVAHAKGLLAGYSPLHPTYTNEAAMTELETDSPTVSKWLQNAGVHGFDANQDRPLIRRTGETFASNRLSDEGHEIKPVADRQQLGYDLQCVGHCPCVFEVKGMTQLGDITLEPSEVKAARNLGENYILTIVYGLPENPVLKRLSKPDERVWEPVEGARIPLDVWRREAR
jgi:hypothetical protein